MSNFGIIPVHSEAQRGCCKQRLVRRVSSCISKCGHEMSRQAPAGNGNHALAGGFPAGHRLSPMVTERNDTAEWSSQSNWGTVSHAGAARSTGQRATAARHALHQVMAQGSAWLSAQGCLGYGQGALGATVMPSAFLACCTTNTEAHGLARTARQSIYHPRAEGHTLRVRRQRRIQMVSAFRCQAQGSEAL